MNTSAYLSVKAISCGYYGHPVLQAIDFEVMRTDRIALCGPNGAGKTTLIKALAGILQLESGSIILDGKDIRSYQQRNLARKIAVVPQETNIFFRITGAEMIALGRTPYLNPFGTLSKKDLEVINHVAEITETTHLLSRYFDEMSSGEKQLIVIARCLAQEPEIIILDEATSNLDIAHTLHIRHVISRINQERGTIIIWISHDINLLLQICSRFILLQSGRIKKIGNAPDILEKSVLSDVFKAEAHIVQTHNNKKQVLFSRKEEK